MILSAGSHTAALTVSNYWWSNKGFIYSLRTTADAGAAPQLAPPSLFWQRNTNQRVLCAVCQQQRECFYRCVARVCRGRPVQTYQISSPEGEKFSHAEGKSWEVLLSTKDFWSFTVKKKHCSFLLISGSSWRRMYVFLHTARLVKTKFPEALRF